MKRVLITGASSGIGRSVAQRFHLAGYYTFLLARDPKRLAELHSELPNSKSIICDLADPLQIAKLPEKIDFNSIDVLINNAGIYFNKPNESFDSPEWQNLFQINVLAPAQLSALLFPFFKRKGGGSVVMISSTLGSKPTANTAAYSASKAALQNLTITLALEGAPDSIRVNCVAPGIVETPIHKLDLLPADQRATTISQMNTWQPLSRIGQTLDIAEAVFFLASEASSWTTGSILNVDGGINIR